MFKTFISYIFFFLLISNVSLIIGQVGLESGLWKFEQYSDRCSGVLYISLPAGYGSGSIVSINEETRIGICVTAAHVVGMIKAEPTELEFEDTRQNFSYCVIVFSDGQTGCNPALLGFDKDSDIAYFSIKIPDGIKVSYPLAKTIPVQEDILTCIGYGGNDFFPNEDLKKVRVFNTHISRERRPDLLFCDTHLLSGDSGGPIINQKNELVGVISGGWFWTKESIPLDSDIRTDIQNIHGNKIQATWPLRAGSIKPLNDTLNRILNAKK